MLVDSQHWIFKEANAGQDPGFSAKLEDPGFIPRKEHHPGGISLEIRFLMPPMLMTSKITKGQMVSRSVDSDSNLIMRQKTT